MPAAQVHRVIRPWHSLVLLGLAAAAAAWPLTVQAFVPDTAAPGEVARAMGGASEMASHARSEALDGSEAWLAFRARNGEWTAEWNGITATPHRATGPAIPLPGFANDSASIDGAIQRFVAESPGVFGAGTRIEARSVRHHGNVWYASYQQMVGGLEVLFADWEFRVSDRGQLMLFGADAWPLAVHKSRALAATASLRMAATLGLGFLADRDAIESLGDPALLPTTDAAGNITSRIVERFRVRTMQPVASWWTLVDAEQGTVVMRVNQARPITGHVSGFVHEHLPTDLKTQRPFGNELIYAGTDSTAADSAITDASGAYAIAGAGTVTMSSALSGPFVNVQRIDLPSGSTSNAFVTAKLPAGAVYDFAWGDTLFSHDAERDAFYHGNIAHAYAKSLEPTMTGLDFSMPIFVNYPYAHCNAVWTGYGIYLFSAGRGCVNTATAPSVLYHEYGHAVNDRVYEGDGITSGMLNASMQEGLADLFAAFLMDAPQVGDGFNGPGTYVRTVYSRKRWPDDQVTDVHANGEILSGAFWDLRRALGLSVASHLVHQAKHGHPDDEHDIIAFKEMFLEVLVADDDDGNLANGTPHGAAIAHAFSAHGLGPNAWLTIDHTPVVEPTASGPVPVTATIRYTGPVLTTLDVNSPAVHYSIDGGPFSTLAMAASGGLGEFGAAIPAASGSVVAYWITAGDAFGDESVAPAGAPFHRLFQIVTGPALPAITWDMESDAGWTAGAPDDDATAGVWVRVDPTESANYDTANFVVLQPANDHSLIGTQCWVTGNADTQYVQGYNDVDGGKTTLTSPIFDAAPSGYENPVIDYWRWYTNNAGSAIGGDVWRVEISNNGGGSWIPLETTALSANSWERQAFRIEDVLTPSHSMRLRFTANDDLPNSLVEAALDDVRLLMFPLGTAVAGLRRVTRTLELLAPSPNPARGTTTLRLSLPTAAHVSLGIFDVGGRRVRGLGDGDLAAGEHVIAWDGLDAAGHPVPAGLYFARLDADREHLMRRVVRIR